MKKQILQIPATRNRSLVTDKARVQSRNCLSSLFDQMFSDSSQNVLFFHFGGVLSKLHLFSRLITFENLNNFW